MGKIHDALEKSHRYATKNGYEPNRTPLSSIENVDSQTMATTVPMYLNSMGKHFDKDLIAYFKPESIEAEQFRKLAASIMFHDIETTGRCLLITSANQGEGKSFLIANLAISLAKSLEEPVLLLDCDLRRPRLHTMFGLGTVTGLSDHLAKGVDISALIQKTSIPGLSLLPAGSKSFHSTELLSSKRMVQLLKTLKNINKKQTILIDSPPPLSTAEPAAIARQVDGVILVIKSGDTPLAMVKDLIKAVGKDKIIGTVLNHFNKRFQKYYKYGLYQ